MLRGINQQQIFEEAEDYIKFLQILVYYKETCKYKIYAYCLMSNHIHLLIHEEAESIEQIFKRIGSKYVYWYNIKYGRKGHLFQDRFKSEPVEDESYFLTVIRYIHQNPVKADICKKIAAYEYSSIKEYLSTPKLVDTEYVYDILPKEVFIEFNNQSSTENCLDVEEIKIQRVTDEQAKKIIQKYSKCSTVAEFQLLDSKLRDKYLKKFKESGISIRQICRLTGLGYYVVQKA